MAELPANEAIARFKTNEDRFDKFINDIAGYIASGGQSVESVRAFLVRMEQVIQDASQIYADTAAGIAATTNGEYFSVVQATPESFITLYQNQSGVAVAVKTYPSSEFFEFVSKVAVLNYAWTVQDERGRIALGVLDDGDVRTSSFHNLTIVNDLPNSFVWALTDEDGRIAFGIRDDGSIVMGDAKVAGAFHELRAVAGSASDPYAYVIEDEDGHIAFGIRQDGTVVIGKAIIYDLTPEDNQALINRSGGIYSDQLNFINNTGQSLGEGSTPATALTTSQEYDNVGFPARALNPTSLLPLTVANTQVGSRGESPMYGALGHIKELIAEENGLTYDINDYQLAACNNAYGGYSITQLNKGTTPYTNAISQVQSISNIAEIQGKTASFQAVLWTQGEADALTGAPMGISVYKGHLKQLAIDYNTDGKSITLQHNNVRLISYQMCSRSRNIAIAQLEASNESNLILVATPTYIFNFPSDDVHIDAESSKWLGAYYGLVYKRAIVDNKEWKPLQPVAHAVLGDTIDMIFNKDGLTFDTTLVPAQPDYGFQVYNDSGVARTLASVTVVGPNRVRIKLQSGSFASGWSVRYGFANAVGKGTFVGGCGNLRDSQGDFIVYSAINKPIHNWCVLFNYGI